MGLLDGSAVSLGWRSLSLRLLNSERKRLCNPDCRVVLSKNVNYTESLKLCCKVPFVV